MIVRPKKVLVFVAHQDDETIGCGGTIKKWTDEGSEVHVCFMTDGSTGIEQGVDGKEIVTTRMLEAKKATTILGVKELHTLNLPCQKVVNKQQTFHKVIELIRRVKPDLVITHGQECKHRDHKRTSAIVEEACWKASENILEELGGTHMVQSLWAFEILDPHDNPDIVVDITEQYESKIKAMNVYVSQEGILGAIYDYLNGIAKVRGYSIGVKYGESFKRIGRVPYRI